jgi:phosphopantetheinyl transferase
VIEWLAAPGRPNGLPAAWLIDLAAPELRRAALALPPTPDDLRRAASRPEPERESVLARRGLVRLCVAAALGADAARITILWSPAGAPLLGEPFADYRLSWAQRERHFACALARTPVGIDIEMGDGGEIPWNALHPREAQALRTAASAEREVLFLRVWAAKEAYVKALGEGLRRDPAEFAVLLSKDEASASIEDRHAASRNRVRIAFAPIAGGVAAVALVAP